MLRVSQAPPRAAMSNHAQDVFCLLLQMAEIWLGWQTLSHRSPFSPVVRLRAQRVDAQVGEREAGGIVPFRGRGCSLRLLGQRLSRRIEGGQGEITPPTKPPQRANWIRVYDVSTDSTPQGTDRAISDWLNRQGEASKDDLKIGPKNAHSRRSRICQSRTHVATPDTRRRNVIGRPELRRESCGRFVPRSAAPCRSQSVRSPKDGNPAQPLPATWAICGP
jgi:hypothetical protein